MGGKKMIISSQFTFFAYSCPHTFLYGHKGHRRSDGGMIYLRQWTTDDKYQQGHPAHALVTVVCHNTKLWYERSILHASPWTHVTTKTHTSLVPHQVCRNQHTRQWNIAPQHRNDPQFNLISTLRRAARALNTLPRWTICRLFRITVSHREI